MPSPPLLHWQNDRLPRLNAVDAQCAATLAIVPPPHLADENLRGYVLLLSAHWQGFCRDLHTECVHAVARFVPPGLRTMFRRQCFAGRQLDGANPRFETLRKDFERFDVNLGVELAVNAANALRITHLEHLNLWRNFAAHHATTMPTSGGPLALATVRSWKHSCDGLATELDGIMYNQLQTVLGAPPW